MELQGRVLKGLEMSSSRDTAAAHTMYSGLLKEAFAPDAALDSDAASSVLYLFAEVYLRCTDALGKPGASFLATQVDAGLPANHRRDHETIGTQIRVAAFRGRMGVSILG